MSALVADGITVRFGGLVAVEDASIDVPAGGFTGLIGPNGAGKTTLFNVVCGFQTPAAGRVTFGDKNITTLPASARAQLGLGRTFQKLELFGRMSVYENLLVASEASTRGLHLASDLLKLPRRRREERRCGAIADGYIETLGLGEYRDRAAGDLPVGTARVVELARALCAEPKLLLLDEPSSGLDSEETRALGAMLRRVNAELGVGILIVEHDMDLVTEVCRDVFVLDFGRVIAHGSPASIRTDAAVRAAYLGEEDDDATPAAPAQR